jgi:hypothetical protein
MLIGNRIGSGVILGIGGQENFDNHCMLDGTITLNNALRSITCWGSAIAQASQHIALNP